MFTTSTAQSNISGTLTTEKLLSAMQQVQKAQQAREELAMFNGKIISSVNVPPDFTGIELPPYSRNRSKRVWEKLMKRLKKWNGYNRVWVINGTSYCHPSVYREIRRSCQ